MADAHDILGIGRSATASASPGAKICKQQPVDVLVPKKKKRRLDGLSRELAELQRDNQSQYGRAMGFMGDEVAEHLAPIVPTAPFKEKPAAARTKAEKWEWAEFTNAARQDGLQLRHWSKASVAEPEYKFARLNQRVSVVAYDDAQYEELYKSATWTRQQTDLLLELLARFDLRFIVAADRFAATYPELSIEDMRERYYEMVRTKMKHDARMDATVDLLQSHVFKFKYNKEHEVKRKAQAVRLGKRTHEEVAEEEELIKTYKKMEQERKKRAVSRKRIQRIASSGGHKKKKAGETGDATIKIKRTASGDLLTVPVTFAGIMRTPLPPVKRFKGTYTRSTQMLVPVAGAALPLTHQIDAKLDELQLPARFMATGPVCAEYNGLRKDIIRLLDLQKATSGKEQELELLRRQLEAKKRR